MGPKAQTLSLRRHWISVPEKYASISSPCGREGLRVFQFNPMAFGFKCLSLEWKCLLWHTMKCTVNIESGLQIRIESVCWYHCGKFAVHCKGWTSLRWNARWKWKYSSKRESACWYSSESESDWYSTAARAEDECTVTAGNRCNFVPMAVVQRLRSHRFAHFNYCSTIASPISTIALKLSQREQEDSRLWCYQHHW